MKYTLCIRDETTRYDLVRGVEMLTLYTCVSNTMRAARKSAVWFLTAHAADLPHTMQISVRVEYGHKTCYLDWQAQKWRSLILLVEVVGVRNLPINIFI